MANDQGTEESKLDIRTNRGNWQKKKGKAKKGKKKNLRKEFNKEFGELLAETRHILQYHP